MSDVISMTASELGGGAELTPEGRVAFTQLAAGDPDAAARLYTEAIHRTAETMEDYSGNTGVRSQIPTQAAGSLQGLVEVALLNESTMRETSDQEYADYRNTVNGAVINTLGGVAGDQGVSGVAVELAKFAATEAFEVSGDAAKPHVGVNGEWVNTESMMGYALGTAADHDSELMEQLEREGIAKEDEAGELYVPPNHADWEISGSDGYLADHYYRIDDEPWPDGESDARGAVEDFVEEFERTSGKWEEQIVDENGVRNKERDGRG